MDPPGPADGSGSVNGLLPYGTNCEQLVNRVRIASQPGEMMEWSIVGPRGEASRAGARRQARTSQLCVDRNQDSPKSHSAVPFLPLTGGRVGHWAVIQSRGRRHPRAASRIHMRVSHSAIDGFRARDPAESEPRAFQPIRGAGGLADAIRWRLPPPMVSRPGFGHYRAS